MTFAELNKHIIPITEFSLKWRFTEEEYDILPEPHLNELKPLDKIGAEFINDYLNNCQIHSEIPFKKNLFQNFDKAKILNGNEKQITKLYTMLFFEFCSALEYKMDFSNVPLKLNCFLFSRRWIQISNSMFF